jgi:magnesium and cobalt exporter, CNNM family
MMVLLGAVVLLILLAALLEEAAAWFVRQGADLLSSEEDEALILVAARSARQARLLTRGAVALAFGLLVIAIPRETSMPWTAIALALACVWSLYFAVVSGIRGRSPWSLLGRLVFRSLAWIGSLSRVLLLAGGRLPGFGAPLSSVERVTELDREMAWLRGQIDRASSDAGAEARAVVATLHQFGEALVEDVMVQREAIVAIRATATLPEIVNVVAGQGYSRYPVYAENLDNIVGVLHVLDLLTAPPGATAVDVSRPPLYTPSTKSVGALLQELQTTYNQMAVVMDEYGGTAGLVTVEDLLEELVGEIEDEHDEALPRIRRLEPGVFWVDATLPLSEVNEILHLDLEEGEYYGTLAGLVLERLERVPRTGERIREDGAWIEVLNAEPNRIQSLKIQLAEGKD